MTAKPDGAEIPILIVTKDLQDKDIAAGVRSGEIAYGVDPRYDQQRIVPNDPPPAV